MTVKILRSRESRATDGITTEILESLADRPGIRFLILGRNPAATRIEAWDGLPLAASVAALAGVLYWQQAQPERFVIGSLPSVILTLAIALNLICVLLLAFKGMIVVIEGKERCRPDESRSAYAVEDGWIHLVEVKDVRIQRTSFQLGNRQVTSRESRAGEMRYDLVFPNRQLAFEGVPCDGDLDAMLKSEKEVRVTSQPRIGLDLAHHTESRGGEESSLA